MVKKDLVYSVKTNFISLRRIEISAQNISGTIKFIWYTDVDQDKGCIKKHYYFGLCNDKRECQS